MNTDKATKEYKNHTMVSAYFCALCASLWLFFAAAPASVAVVQQQVDKELDERLLYLLSQRQTPSVEVIQQLLDKGARVNQPVTYKTALMHAASEGHVEIVKLLLARKRTALRLRSFWLRALTQITSMRLGTIIKISRGQY